MTKIGLARKTPDWQKTDGCAMISRIATGMIPQEKEKHMNTEEAIFTRRSIRKYEDRPVEDEKIEKLLRAAMAAPSAMNQQPWEFYVVKSKEKIKELAGTSPFAAFVGKAPLAIVICQKNGFSPAAQFKDVDCSIASENLWLMATELGLGAVWIGTAPAESRIERVGKVLGLPKNLKAFSLFAIGYPAEEKDAVDRYDEKRVHVI